MFTQGKAAVEVDPLSIFPYFSETEIIKINK